MRKMADLLTGLAFAPDKGTAFCRPLAEPGTETVPGKRYGGAHPAVSEDIHAAPRALARHIAGMPVVHFVSGAPTRPCARACRGLDFHRGRPEDGLRGASSASVGPGPGTGQSQDAVRFRDLGLPRAGRAGVGPARGTAQRLMGQVSRPPPGPDGLPEERAAWVPPQGLAARVQWAFLAPQYLRPAVPDPRDFLETPLGGRPPGMADARTVRRRVRYPGTGRLSRARPGQRPGAAVLPGAQMAMRSARRSCTSAEIRVMPDPVGRPAARASARSSAAFCRMPSPALRATPARNCVR